MVGVRRCVATSTLVWPAIPSQWPSSPRPVEPSSCADRLPAPDYQVWVRQAATCPWMIQSGGRRPVLHVPLRMIQSLASGLISPVNARFVLRPFLLVLPRMIQSWALLGLVSALLHYHGLVQVFASPHHHGLPLLATALPLHDLVLVAAAPLRLGLGLLFTLLHHHGFFLPMVALPLLCCTPALSSRLLLCIHRPHPYLCSAAAPRPRPHLCCPASPRPRPLLCLPAFPRSCPLRGFWSCLLRRTTLVSASCFLRLWPRLSPGRSSLGVGDPFWLIRPGHSCPGQQTFCLRPRWLWLPLLVLPQMLRSEASAHHVSLDFRFMGAVAPAACSNPDVPIWGFWPPFVPG